MLVQARIADRYEIKELLGQGGMGIVYRALDIKTRSDVALKTMRDASDPAAVEMFEKEWALLAGISHPNIVDIRDVGEIEENGQKKPFFVMPFLRGATLAYLIEDSSARLTVERVVSIITQVCRALQIAHDGGLIHRDIKPSNIFVMEDDTAKVIDFGVVHLAGTHSVTGHKGTWQYMAPEQVDLMPATPSSDLFSVGVVCYEALTGKKPFARSTPIETAEAIRKYIPPPASELNPAVTQLVSMVVHRAMAKEPIHRFVNARELGETLQKAFLNQRIERFDPARIQPRIERAKKALSEGDEGFAAEILAGLEAEGNVGLEITLLRGQIEQRSRQKKIRQLLETARTRLEQDEIPLALEKIQEILGIDQENSEALALRFTIEKQRNERQIESWMVLARKHLDRHDFGEARQALREVLRIRPADTAAGDLLAETDRREQQSLRIRSERDQLYGSAMRAYQNGEMSSALSKLERLLELGSQTPDASVPERDAAYQIFYNQVRTERDTIQNGYEAVRRHLADKAFDHALEICDDFSGKYPNDALFQALKLEAVEQQRQEQSAYIAEVGRRVDAEPDLDRKVSILKQACERYPAEQQFQQSLKITRERRDLAFSIVAKARQYEERNQFAEALGQWDILHNLYPRYPGIDVEIAQLTKRREAQAKDESKARLVETIDRALDSSDYARARDLAAGALEENPQDAEFAGLERRAREGLERSSQARALLIQGQQLIEESHFEEAVDVLRRASGYDLKSTLIRDTLVQALLEQARPFVDDDWRRAEPLVQQACDLDASHPGARSFRGLVLDAKRKEYVPQCLAEARDLVESGNAEAALEKIETALSQYPNDVRLLQFHTTVQNSVRDIRSKQEREKDFQTLRELRQDAETRTVKDDWQSILERSQSIWTKYPDDQEISAVASEIQLRAAATVPTPGVAAAPARETVSSEVTPQNVAPGTVAPAPTPSALTAQRPLWSRLSGLASALLARLPWPEHASANGSKGASILRSRWWPFIVIASIATLAIGLALLRPRPAKQPLTHAPTTVRVSLKVTPEDAVVTVDGKIRSGELELDTRVSYFVKATKVGYSDYQGSLKATDPWDIKLEPAPMHLSLSAIDKTGEVFVDDQKKGDLVDGILPDVSVIPDSNDHTLTLKNGSTEILSLIFVADGAKEPLVKQIRTKDLQAITSLTTAATLYSSTQGVKANLVGQPPQAIPPEGLKLEPTQENHEVAFDRKDLANIPIPMESFPVLTVALHPQPMGIIKIACGIEGAHLFIDGKDRGWQCRNGFWTVTRSPGDHAVTITAPGYNPYEKKITFKEGDNDPLTPKLDPLVTLGTLEVQGGTPQAEVWIDGEKKDQLDNNGSGQIENIQPGTRRIVFRKDGFEDLPLERTFTARKAEKIAGDQVRLKQFGTLIFQISPAGATISYSRSDDGPKIANGGRVSVRAGHYRVEATLSGYESNRDDFDVVSGGETSVRWTLVPVKKTSSGQPVPTQKQTLYDIEAFEKCGNQLEIKGGWLDLKGSEYCFLKEGVRQVRFTFNSQTKKLFHSNKIRWTVHFLDASNYVEYEMDEKGITRRVTVKGTEDKKLQKDFKHDRRTRYVIALDVQKDQILVSDENGNEIDRMAGEDLNHGRIGLKGSIGFFKVEAK
jgi:serine/threonine-protein kinase